MSTSTGKARTGNYTEAEARAEQAKREILKPVADRGRELALQEQNKRQPYPKYYEHQQHIAAKRMQRYQIIALHEQGKYMSQITEISASQSNPRSRTHQTPPKPITERAKDETNKHRETQQEPTPSTLLPDTTELTPSTHKNDPISGSQPSARIV